MQHYCVGVAVACCVLLTQGAAHGAEEASPSPFTEPAVELSLPNALTYTLEHNPGLAVFTWDIRAAEARAIQAALRPNPELSVELEDVRFGGSSSGTSERGIGFSPADGLSIGAGGSSTDARNSAFGDAQFTVSLSQLIELGGKRAKRIEVADRERDVASWDYEVSRADALAETARAFYTVLAAQERLAISDELVELATRAQDTVRVMVDAGKVSAIELSRAEVELGNLSIAAASARRELEAARIELAGNWGNISPAFSAVVGRFPDTFALPTAESLRAAIDQSPYSRRWTAEIDMRDAVVTLEKANAKSDVTVMLGARLAGSAGASERGWNLSSTDGFGYNHSRTDSDTDGRLVLGLSVPLRLFNRNQGNIKEAESLSEKASQQRRAADVVLNTALNVSTKRAAGAHERARALEASVIPAATEAFGAVQEGYRAGKFGLLDVLMSQRALYDSQIELAETRAFFLQTLVEIERVTGLPVDPIQPAEPAAQAEN